MNEPVYKILTMGQWRQALATSSYGGAPVDVSDGYIHLSKKPQIEETLRKHFEGSGNLMLFRFDPQNLGNELKYEEARGGDLFPHLYGTLDIKRTSAVFPIMRDVGGSHLLPARY